jgi:NADPH-dependent 2,4-dienoyl-CoA reductase/sulfur reductase-like enzyme
MTIRTADDTLVVVGASLAGLRAVETARTEGFGGRLVVVGDEPHRPYDRPPLSKKLLSGEWDADRIQLRSPEVFDEIDAEWRFGTAATHLDAGGRKLWLDDGSELDFDALVIASGSRCRRLPDQPGYVHELRTLDDSLRLRDELAPGDRRVVVIGAGFIGLEVAATARQAGNEVTVLESADAPLIRGCGAEMGRLIGALHSAEGVEIRCGVFVEQLHPDGVLLRGGERVAADVIVVGIGVTPSTEWLAGSDLLLRDGVVCDSALRVTRTDGSVDDSICAAGDVARWWNPLFAGEMRIEHWTNAAEQGALAAKNLLAERDGAEEYAPVPFVWSDQFSHRIQFLGRSSPGDEVIVAAGSAADGKFLALYGRDGVLRGALGVSAPRWAMPMRGAIGEQMSWEDAITFASELAG